MSEKNTGKKVTVVFAAAAILIGFLSISGVHYYAGVRDVKAENTTILCLVPESEILSSNALTVGGMFAAFLIVFWQRRFMSSTAAGNQQPRHSGMRTGGGFTGMCSSGGRS